MDVMMGLSSSTVILLLAICAIIKEGLAIKCYMCNSAPSRNDHNCVDLRDGGKMFEQNCDHLPEARHSGIKYTVCRKMTQTIYDPDGNSEKRIVRQCGTETETGCTWQTRPNTLQVEACHCKTDLCNGALPSQHGPSALVSFISAATCILILSKYDIFL